MNVTETNPAEKEGIGTSYAAIRSEIEQEDDKNKLSVFINDISVKTKMPLGTVNALMYCLAAIVVVGAIVLVGFIWDWSTSYYETAEYQRRVEATKDSIIEGKEHFAEHSDTAIIIAIHELEARDSSNVENNNSNTPYADYQDAWETQQMEEAMNSLAEEAMREEAQERAMEDAMNSMDPFR